MSASTPTDVWRSTDGAAPTAATDHVVAEEPLEIRIAGQTLSVTMRTPGADRELAMGLLYAEGVIAAPHDVLEVRQASGGPTRNVVDVIPAPGVAADLSHLARHVIVSSACGLCGKTTLDALHRRLPTIDSGVRVGASTLLTLPARLAEAQPTFARTGGLHAAALFDAGGTLLAAREDVGRHNAVDKVVGWAFLERRLPLGHHVLLVSGRASFEIVQKAIAAGIPVVGAVSAPSSAAITLADQGGQTLIAFLRPPRLTIYTHRDRLRFGP